MYVSFVVLVVVLFVVFVVLDAIVQTPTFVSVFVGLVVFVIFVLAELVVFVVVLHTCVVVEFLVCYYH